MCCSCKPGHDTQPDVDQEYSCYRQAAYEVVQGVAYENQIGQWFFAFGVGPVTVVPMQELFKGEKDGEARQDPDIKCGSVTHGGDASGYHVEEGTSDQ